MSESDSTHSEVRTIRLPNEQIIQLLDRLDEDAQASVGAGAVSREYAYRKGLIVDMLQPGAVTPTRYAVQPRRISESELWILHGSFLHTGTQCTVQLVTLHGTWASVTGAVSHCRYLEENIHDVCVQFLQRIDPALFCPEAGRTRVLLVEEDDALARLAEFHLSQLNADVEHVQECRRAIDLALEKRYDVILFDVEMNGGEGFEAVKELRSTGYTQTIVAFSALQDPGEHEPCMSAGCDLVLTKPFSRDDIRTLLHSLRRAPLLSSFYNDPSMTPLVNKFVAELPEKVRAIEKALISENIGSLQTMVRGLRAQGSSYGFEVLTDAARVVESELFDGEITKTARSKIDHLVKLCMQARCAETGTGD